MMASCDHLRIAKLMNSVPLSLTMLAGRLRTAMAATNSRATRKPESEVSATNATHSRVKSSTTVKMRKRRWQNISETKSSDHLWFGPCGIVMGERVPRALLRPPIARQAIAKQMPRGTFAYLQSLFAIKPSQLFDVHHHTFTLQHLMQSPITKSFALIRMSMAETKCARRRRKSVPVWLIKKGGDALGSVCMV